MRYRKSLLCKATKQGFVPGYSGGAAPDFNRLPLFSSKALWLERALVYIRFVPESTVPRA